MCRVRRIGGKGSENGQFNSPSQLTTDLIGCVFIADTDNDRICIHDPDLNHLDNITFHSMERPSDVKISRDRIYVLCPDNCIWVLTLEGNILGTIIYYLKGRKVLEPLFFCLDSLSNIVLRDLEFHSIRVFSPKGYLLHTIVGKDREPGMLRGPMGIAITANGRLACVAQNWVYCLLIF